MIKYATIVIDITAGLISAVLNSFEDEYPELVYFAYKCREFIIDMYNLTYFLFRVYLQSYASMNANSY